MKRLLIVLFILVLLLAIAILFTMWAEARDKISELEAENFQLQSDLSSANNDLASLNTELQNTKSELDTVNSQISKLQLDISDAQSALEESKLQLSNTQLALSDAEARLEQSVLEVADMIETATYFMTLATYWESKFLNADPSNVSYSYAFETVEELVSAIKKNPNAYNNKNVKVLGVVLKNTSTKDTFILDDDGYDYSKLSSDSGVQYRYWVKTEKENGTILDIKIKSDAQYTVLTTGDYVKLYGTVRISNGTIYLDSCEYSMISPISERK